MNLYICRPLCFMQLLSMALRRSNQQLQKRLQRLEQRYVTLEMPAEGMDIQELFGQRIVGSLHSQ